MPSYLLLVMFPGVSRILPANTYIHTELSTRLEILGWNVKARKYYHANITFLKYIYMKVNK